MSWGFVEAYEGLVFILRNTEGFKKENNWIRFAFREEH